MNNYPDLYFDYVGATGENSITEYINYTSNINYLYTSNSSNIIENDILITSNILENHSSNYTSNLRFDINQLINEETEQITLPIPYDKKNTYIYNSNLLGEIRFYCESAKDFIVVIPEGVPDYRTKIDVDGKLKIFYTYDPAINATYLNGWVDVANSIVALNASDANIGITIGGLQAEIYNNFKVLEAEINALIMGMSTMGLTDEEADYLRTLVRSTREIRFELTNSIDNFYYLLRDAFFMRNTNLFNSAINVIGVLISTNPTIAFFLGAGGVAYGFIYGALQNLNYLNSISASLKENIYTNSNITSNRRADFLSSNFEQDINTYVQLSSNIYNFSISQGFLNSNTITQQYLNSINTNELKISQTNISNIFVASNVLSNINLNQGFINSNITNQQYIYDLKTDNLFLNNGNVSGVNSINVNNLIISGKIKQFGSLLDETYLLPEDLYNLSYNYTTERRYPPKTFNTSTTEKGVQFLGNLVYNQTLILDNTGITYGEGQYEIYSSSTYDNGITTKDKLFNFDNTETTNTARWGINQFNSGTGDYQGNSSIDGVHFGDWIIIKLPLPFVLTRFRIYKNSLFPQLAPSLWKCFGSSDGVEFHELFQAHNFTRLTEANYNLGYYEKTLATTFTTLYNYIGFSFNSLTGLSGATSLNFAELQLFGKEQLSYNIDSYKYTSSNAVKYLVRNEMPDVGKRQAFYVSIPASATYYDGISATTYYKYDLDLSLYTKTQTIANTSDLMRIFKIRFWYAPSYFGSYIYGEPYVSSYEVYMSYKANPILGKPETAGLNIYAVGFPDNTKLANILPNQLMLLRNVSSSLNYITIVSRTAPCDIYVIIEDMLY